MSYGTNKSNVHVSQLKFNTEDHNTATTTSNNITKAVSPTNYFALKHSLKKLIQSQPWDQHPDISPDLD